jgi:hypothetical protein
MKKERKTTCEFCRFRINNHPENCLVFTGHASIEAQKEGMVGRCMMWEPDINKYELEADDE